MATRSSRRAARTEGAPAPSVSTIYVEPSYIDYVPEPDDGTRLGPILVADGERIRRCVEASGVGKWIVKYDPKGGAPHVWLEVEGAVTIRET